MPLRMKKAERSDIITAPYGMELEFKFRSSHHRVMTLGGLLPLEFGRSSYFTNNSLVTWLDRVQNSNHKALCSQSYVRSAVENVGFVSEDPGERIEDKGRNSFPYPSILQEYPVKVNKSAQYMSLRSCILPGKMSRRGLGLRDILNLESCIDMLAWADSAEQET
ncbi:hypothetical protein BJX76DRAFT_261730 [Aspergillus varians]